jgi:hypothetical protein
MRVSSTAGSDAIMVLKNNTISGIIMPMDEGRWFVFFLEEIERALDLSYWKRP